MITQDHLKRVSPKLIVPVLAVVIVLLVAGIAYTVVNRKKDTAKVLTPRAQALQDYKNKDYTKAQESLKKEVAAKPEDPSNYNILGNVTRDAGDSQAAIDYYKKALEVDPKYLPTYINLANLYINNGQRNEASAIADAGLKLFPGNSTLTKLKADAQGK